MNSIIKIRKSNSSDRPFILGLSPQLSEVANLGWHADVIIEQFQDAYIEQMLDQKDIQNTTLIAERGHDQLGFIHICEMQDSISGENCATVPLLAVAPIAQGHGIGKMLLGEAEAWSRKRGYRLLHLEVFANNEKAQGFYKSLGFQPETLAMIKPL